MGCWSTYPGLRPLEPEPGTTIETLQPTLRWEPAEEAGVTYDVRVEEALNSQAYRNPNDVPFYKEGLQTSACVVEPPLKPGRRYLWAVRVRKGSEVTAWSTYDQSWFALMAGGTDHDIRYSFMTSPKATAPKGEAAPSPPGPTPTTPGS